MFPALNPLCLLAQISGVCAHVLHRRNQQFVLIRCYKVFSIHGSPVPQDYLARVLVRRQSVRFLKPRSKGVRTVRFQRFLIAPHVQSGPHSEGFMGSAGSMIFVGRRYRERRQLIGGERDSIGISIPCNHSTAGLDACISEEGSASELLLIHRTQIRNV